MFLPVYHDITCTTMQMKLPHTKETFLAILNISSSFSCNPYPWALLGKENLDMLHLFLSLMELSNLIFWLLSDWSMCRGNMTIIPWFTAFWQTCWNSIPGLKQIDMRSISIDQLPPIINYKIMGRLTSLITPHPQGYPGMGHESAREMRNKVDSFRATGGQWMCGGFYSRVQHTGSGKHGEIQNLVMPLRGGMW